MFNSGKIEKIEEERKSFLKSFLSKLSKEVRMKVLIPALTILGLGIAGEKILEEKLEKALETKSWKPDNLERESGYWEKISPQENWEKVKAQCIYSAFANPDLNQELGGENIETLIKCIKETNFNKRTEILAEISGLPQEQIEKEKVNFIYIISEAEEKNPETISRRFENVQSFETRVGGHHTHNDGIFVISRQIKNREGQINKDRLIHIVTHEYLHVLTSELSIESQGYYAIGAQIYPWGMKGVPLAFYEGATEYINCLIGRELGEGEVNIRELGYDPGIRAALIISEIVGKDVFVRDYLNGDMEEIEANFDERLGEGAFQELLKRMRQDMGVEFTGHDSARAQRACSGVVYNFMGEKGIDISEFQEAYTDLFFSER